MQRYLLRHPGGLVIVLGFAALNVVDLIYKAVGGPAWVRKKVG